MCFFIHARTHFELHYRVYQKKVFSWKILAKLTRAEIWRKLSVSGTRLTHSGTSSTKIISNYIVL